jgi:hypothetical protein
LFISYSMRGSLITGKGLHIANHAGPGRVASPL